MLHRRRWWRSNIGWILRVLVRHSSIVILGSHLLWIIRRIVRIHVRIVHGLWILLILIIRPSPAHIWRHALPCRQMTTVHHAGLGTSSKPTAFVVGLELRDAGRTVVDVDSFFFGLPISAHGRATSRCATQLISRKETSRAWSQWCRTSRVEVVDISQNYGGRRRWAEHESNLRQDQRQLVVRASLLLGANWSAERNKIQVDSNFRNN